MNLAEFQRALVAEVGPDLTLEPLERHAGAAARFSFPVKCVGCGQWGRTQESVRVYFREVARGRVRHVAGLIKDRRSKVQGREWRCAKCTDKRRTRCGGDRG